MRILIIGFLVFTAWTILATHIYVCNIKGLCYEPASIQMSAVSHSDIIAADTLRAHTTGIKTESPNDEIVYFAFDKSDFNSNAGIDKYFDESNSYMGQNAQARLSITGYTDAIGSDEYNQALGYRRAQSMRYYFESKGILPAKIIIESKGEKEPADDNNTTAGKAHNRRTTITIKK